MRSASAKDSVTPDRVGFLLQAVRAETARLIASVASAGQVDLSPITGQLAALDSRLSALVDDSSGFAERLAALEEALVSVKARLSPLEEYITEVEVSVDAPALLPFYGVAPDGVNALEQSTTARTRAIFDAKNGRFVAQAANAAGVFPVLPYAGTFYLGGDMVKYNFAGKARTDLLFVCGADLYSFDGTNLIKHTGGQA